jgi:hypothetical protein
MKKAHDVKFIIYQSLYILVISIIAIKHANLDLNQVIDAEGKEISFISEDSLRKLYELIKIMKMVDTTNYVIIDKKVLEENEKLAELYRSQPPVPDITGMVKLMPGQRITTLTPEEEKKIEEIKRDPGEMKDIRIGNITMVQYHKNVLNNPYDEPLEVVGIATIPPKSTGSFVTAGQNEVVVKVGGQTKTISLKPKEKPKISISRIASMSEDTRVTTLQGTTCFRVTIDDPYPEDLKVSYSGPITVKQSGSAYDVTLNAFTSRAQFDNFTENKSSPYSLGFTFTCVDNIAGFKVTAQQSFIFGDF